MARRSVLQEWVQDLPLMQQAVLISAIRGPDGLHKHHVSKHVLYWLRRSSLISAFSGRPVLDPINGQDKTFTGVVKHPDPAEDAAFRRAWFGDGFTHDHLMQSRRYWEFILDGVADEYLCCVDEVPHHFHLHLMHAAEILGYKHPETWIRAWWCRFYIQLVYDAHMHPESADEMDRRLGDNEAQWREREVVPND